MAISIKYQIWYSTSATGPWTLATQTPIDHSDGGNFYLLTGLQDGSTYYVLIVGGVMSGSEFIPMMTQPIGGDRRGLRNVGAHTTPAIRVKYKVP